MPYQCHCEDGPAGGKVFFDHGLQVRVVLSHRGERLEYRLTDILDDHCKYRFHAPLDEVSAAATGSAVPTLAMVIS